MPAATTAAHVARPCAALAQRLAPAKQRRKRQRPVRSAQHAARALTIAKAEIGPIATVRMVTAPIQIAHGPTARLAIALIAQKVIAPSMTALVSVMTTAAENAAPIVAETSVGVLTTAMVHAMTHVRIRVAQVAMTATPRKHRAHQPSRQSAVMTTARCVCPS
ncbi:MAG: hypothetical protein RLZZ369_576 [Pseudomonadota bacterium]